MIQLADILPMSGANYLYLLVPSPPFLHSIVTNPIDSM